MKNYEKVAKLYNQFGESYSEIVKKTSNNFDYELVSFYQNNCIKDGTILDLGCGNGRTKDFLGNNFNYTGVDYSLGLLKLCPYENKIQQDIVSAVKKIDNYSFDHVIGLSSFFFLNQEEFDFVLDRILKIARKSIFFTCEQFRDGFSEEYFGSTEVKVYTNKPKTSKVGCSDLKLLWKTSKNQEPIFGYICTVLL